MKLSLKMGLAVLGLATLPFVAADASAALSFDHVGTYSSGIFDDSAAEISAYDPTTQRVFVVNAKNNTIDIIDVSNPVSPVKFGEIDGSPYGGSINSVAVKNGVVAFASQAVEKTNAGSVVFASTSGVVTNSVTVGALPDMLTFTPDGNKILVANEGEVNEINDGINPAGSISIIDLSGGVGSATVSTADFSAFNGLAATAGDSTKSSVRISPFASSAAQDIEPEYIGVSADGSKAYVSLQENNAIAVLDLNTNTVTHVLPLGVKDHSKADSGFISYDGVNNSSNALDASNQDGGINIKNWDNLYGIYMPDAIAVYEVAGKTYVVTANEGDSRADWEGYNDEGRLRGNTTDTFFAGTRENDQAGRINISLIDGVVGGNRIEAYAFGARSFSIWDVTDPSTWVYDPITGNMSGLVYDSGDDFEQITAMLLPASFNTSNNGNEFDNRSDDKGPEPEAVTVAEIDGRYYAFVALERIGGFMVYDVTNPLKPVYIDYINPTRNFDPTLEELAIGDLGPESITFIKAVDSPTGKAMLVIANEVSGTTSLFEINITADAAPIPEPTTAMLGLMGMGAMGLMVSRRRRN